MRRIAIIGGGISGLAAAYYIGQARRAGSPLDWMLYESSDRLGGVIKTERRDGFLMEGGPDSFLAAKPAAAELAGELGLADQLIPSNDARRKTYILHRGRLVAMPDGLQMMVPTNPWATALSPLFSWKTKSRMLREFLFPPEALAIDEDESVAGFVERHFGSEVVDRLASPLLAGVYGGDAALLSARSVLPSFVAMELEHRSLVRGVLRSRKRLGAPLPLFTSFRGGMQQFTDAIEATLPSLSLRKNTPIVAMHRENESWRVVSRDGRYENFSDVVIAAPAYVAATLLRTEDTQLADELSQIEYASSVTISLAYGNELRIPGGFGFLVPRAENRRMLACTFVHQKFSGRTPQGSSLLRIFLSGIQQENDASLVALARAETAEILGVIEPPMFAAVTRWPHAMPQYPVRHERRLSRIEERTTHLPGVHLIGNSFRGVGISDCIRTAKNMAAKLLA